MPVKGNAPRRIPPDFAGVNWNWRNHACMELGAWRALKSTLMTLVMTSHTGKCLSLAFINFSSMTARFLCDTCNCHLKEPCMYVARRGRGLKLKQTLPWVGDKFNLTSHARLVRKEFVQWLYTRVDSVRAPCILFRASNSQPKENNRFIPSPRGRCCNHTNTQARGLAKQAHIGNVNKELLSRRYPVKMSCMKPWGWWWRTSFDLSVFGAPMIVPGRANWNCGKVVSACVVGAPRNGGHLDLEYAP